MECPQCGGPAKQVIFGLPAEPLTEEEQGRYIFGGCMIDDWNGPAFQCARCHYQWVVDELPTRRP